MSLLFSSLIQILKGFKEWANDNPGFLTVIIFSTTLFLGWVTGIFKSLARRPKFKLLLSSGPTFCCTFDTGEKSNNHPTHRTAITLYLTIRNIGKAPSSFRSVRVGYHNYNLKYRFLWCWLDCTPELPDFGNSVGENLRVFPFLLQQSCLHSREVPSYLREGEEATGVVYFEQEEAWGNFKPIVQNGGVKIKVSMRDVFGRKYLKTFYIPSVSIDHARKYNPEFGNFIKLLRTKKPEDRND